MITWIQTVLQISDRTRSGRQIQI